MVELSMVARALGLDEVPMEMIREVSREIIGRELDLTEKDVRDAADPRINVERRKSTGGPSPVEVERIIEDRLAVLADAMKRRAQRLERYEVAKAEVEKEIDRLLA